MKQLQKYKTVIIIILSFITTCCISLQFNSAENTFQFESNNFKWIMIWAIIAIVFKVTADKMSKRSFRYAFFVGILLSLFWAIGFTTSQFLAENLMISKKCIFYILAKLEVLITVLTSLFVLLYHNLPILADRIKEKGKKEYSYFTANKKSLFLVAILFFICYIPYFLQYFPGIVLTDSAVQLIQGFGDLPLDNHHPTVHTLLIHLCMKIGQVIGGGNQAGVVIYTIGQMIVTSFVFSFVLFYMAKKKVPTVYRIFAFVFLAFCPMISVYTITMYKDIPFALSVALLTIGIIEIITNPENIFKSKKNSVLFMIVIACTMFFRNNGMYVIILLLPFMLWIYRKQIKKIILLFGIPLIVYFVVTGPIYSMINVQPGSIGEALSIPMQQFARVSKYKGEELTQEEKSKIYQYLPVENIGQYYTPGISDPVKSKFSQQGFKEDKIGFVKLYAHFAFKYPGHTLASFLANSYGYYYPNTFGWGVYTDIDQELLDKYGDYGIHRKSLIHSEVVTRLANGINEKKYPIISMVINIGFLFWIIILAAGYVIYRKNLKGLLMCLPTLFVWLTALASPVFAESRYVYCIFTCIPILLSFSMNEKYSLKSKKDEKK